MLRFYDKKYRNLKKLYPHILKSLVYFEDADEDKTKPKMLISCDWKQMKKYFLAEVPKLLSKELRKIR